MKKYIVMGPQGSGKGTQAKLLCQDLGLVHVSVGDVFRWNVQNRTKLGARVQRLMHAGRLVPDELVWEVVRERLGLHDWNYGFVLDGFPRNRAQAELFLESYDIDAVVLIEVPDAEVMHRMLSRRLCADCGLDYNLIQHRPKQADTCDVCGGHLVPRPDDSPEAIRARLAEYHAATRPIVELFRRKELVAVVDGTRQPTEVQGAIRAQLGLPAPVVV